jgi:glycosyltransferase involved in cell wall biosynthesis
MDITVILNCYKRIEYLDEQISAIENQSIPPKEIWIWQNSPEDREKPNLEKYSSKCKIVSSNFNFKFHGRFSLALLARTKYVCFFDDDAIPGEKWFENCLNTIENGYDGILGCAGVILNERNYLNIDNIGSNGIKSDVPIEVDLVGHSWFFNKKYLKYMWIQDPISWENGEDMQLSYLSQKYGKIKTYVPPHPEKNKELWGSIKEDYGDDDNASYKIKDNFHFQRSVIIQKYIKNGWKTINNIE